MTYLQLINAVLARLRERAVATIDASDYVELIGAYINESKREVEDAWNWTVLRSSVSVSATSSTDIYELAATNQRTRLLDAYNSTSKWQLGEYANSYMNHLNNMTTTTGSPQYYSNSGVTAATGVRKVRLYPFPDGNYTLSFNCVIPQADLAAASTVLSIPSQPVIDGAYLRAINERGEDQGRLSEIQANIYRISLTDAISQDAALHEDETLWLPI